MTAPAIVYDAVTARQALTRVREAWTWLTDAAVPGRSTPLPAMAVSEVARQIEADQIRRDRAAARMAVRAGRSPNPHRDAAEVGPVSARALVLKAVTGTAGRMWAARTGTALSWVTVQDPTTRIRTVDCWHCDGKRQTWESVGRDQTGEHVIERVNCPACRGWGQVASGNPCTVCLTSGSCWCDRADAYMSHATRILGIELDKHPTTTLAADAARVLTAADVMARRAARAAELEVPLPIACPVCRYRDLVAVCRSEDRAAWVVECRTGICLCKGSGCPCGRQDRHRDRPHHWPAHDWTALSERSNAAKRRAS